MKIKLIRHSKTIVEPERYNPLWSLNEAGVQDAQKLSEQDIIQDIEVIYTSDQLKAIHTGVIIASKIGVPLHQHPNLTELTSLTNSWKADYEGFIKDIYSGNIERYEDGESLQEATERFTKALEEVVEKEKDKEVIGIVAHGNVLSLFCSQFEDREPLEIHHAIKMPDIAVLDWETKTFSTTFGTYDINN